VGVSGINVDRKLVHVGGGWKVGVLRTFVFQRDDAIVWDLLTPGIESGLRKESLVGEKQEVSMRLSFFGRHIQEKKGRRERAR